MLPGHERNAPDGDLAINTSQSALGRRGSKLLLKRSKSLYGYKKAFPIPLHLGNKAFQGMLHRLFRSSITSLKLLVS